MFKSIKMVMALLAMLLFTGCGGSGGGSDDGKTPLADSTDLEAPKITINGKSSITIIEGTTYTDAGATAKDAVDGTVTVTTSGRVDSSKVGTYTITYTATDKAGNKATKKRTVKVVAKGTPIDTTAPTITLNGNSSITIKQGTTYTDAGATAKDAVDGTVTVTTSGSVDSSKLGTYTITYTATDKAGNKANVTRTVTVKSADDMVWNVSNMAEFRQALEDASLNGKNDRIVLNAGIYKTTSDGLGTFTFDDNEAFNLTIESAKGLTYSDVILDGNTTQQVFNFNNSDNVTLILKGISIINGRTSSKGGGIYCNKNIKIKDCNISNNIVSSGSGGGFYATGTTTIINSTISNNKSVIHSKNFEDSNGGGFYSNGGTTITNSTISNNSCRANSSFENSNGGGFYSASSTTIINSTIYNNNSSARFSNSESNGGGFYSSGTTNIINSTISNNNINRAKFSYSDNHGAGFYVKGTVILINSLISNNNSEPLLTLHSYSKTTIGTSFYSYNAYISNNNFIGNKGSIATQGIFVNNIFDSNDADITLIGESKIYNNYIDYSKIEDNNFNVIKKRNLQPTSVGDINLNDDNKTLKSDSPIIDKGLNPNNASFKKIIDNDDIYTKIIELLKTDMFGNKRIHNGTIDMGAVEYGSSK